MTILQDFLTQFPKFDEAAVTAAFPSLLNTYPSFYDKAYDNINLYCTTNKAILYLIAHMYVIDKTPSDGQINQFTSSGVDGVSGTFRIKTDSTDFISFFSATKYGQVFLQMIKRRQGGVFV